MKRIWLFLTFLIIAGGLVALWYAQAGAVAEDTTGTGVGQRAPDFTGTTINGETVRLSDFRGRTVLINDFASWCGPCLLETPHLVEVYNARQGEVAIIGLNLREHESHVAGYRDEFNIPYPLVLDPQGQLTQIYNPLGLPTSWFIDPEGIVRYIHSGPMTVPMIEEVLLAIAEGREPDVFSAAGPG